MSPLFHDVCLASLPVAALPVLADLRTRPDVRVGLRGGRAWVRWPPGEEAVPRRLLAVAGVELFARRGEHWHRPGESLPSFGLPGEGDIDQSLAALLTPEAPTPETAGAPAFHPTPLDLVREDRPRTASALLCPLPVLGAWADRATTRQLESLEAVVCAGRVLLRGERLPALAGERFWGRRVLLPLGCRADPELADEVLAEALGLQPGEVALLTGAGVEVVGAGLLAPLSRAAVRRAAGEAG